MQSILELQKGAKSKKIDRNTTLVLFLKYQPSGEGGTHSPPATPAKSNMAARGPQNGRWDLERCLPVFWRSDQFSLKSFLSEHSFYGGEKNRGNNGKERENKDENSGHY